MLKTLTAAATLLIGVSSLAFAADPPKSATQPPVATAPSAPPTTTATGTTAGSGTSTMSESDLKKRLEQQGYSSVSLKADSAHKGEWAGTATKGGKPVQLHVDASGKVIGLDGVDLDIRPGTQSGSVLTLRAHGAPRLRATGRGNLIVHVEVTTPTRLDPEQEKLMRELAALRGEDQPESHREAQGGLFSRVRDAFNGR